MEIKYLGHSSFKLKGKEGTLVTDPFDTKAVGLPYLKIASDIVTISHDHEDHNQTEKITGTTTREIPFVVDKPGEYEVSGIGVIGIKSFHDDKEGALRGGNVIYVIQMDGIVIAHLGDLGHLLTDKQVEKIGPIDVLMVPVGGEFTIGPSEAEKVIEQLSPSVVIPMHYKTSGMNSSFDGLVTVDEFLEKSGFGIVKREDKLVLSESSLPEEIEVVVLSS